MTGMAPQIKSQRRERLSAFIDINPQWIRRESVLDHITVASFVAQAYQPRCYAIRV
jgi:hypothetical protein